MSKAVPLDHEFNKGKFAELLMQAQGKRTQAQFAQDCGLSAAHLNRFYNLRKESPPIPSTIIKIAQNAENGVTGSDLLDAAGYDPEKNYTIYKTDLNAIEDAIMHDCKFILQIRLFHSAFKWSKMFVEDDYGFLLDEIGYSFGIDIDNSDVLEHWFFITEYFHCDMRDDSVLSGFYGRLCCTNIPPKTKVSLVVSSDEAFDIIKTNPPIMIPIYFSVIIMEANMDTSITEKYLPTALEIPDDLKTVFTLEEKD